GGEGGCCRGSDDVRRLSSVRWWREEVASVAGRSGDGSEGGGEMVVFGCGVAAAGNGCGGGGEKVVMVVVVERAAVARW
ncbi:hypothetical protein Tco_1130688, partial [Tanacetum coccineum]